MLRRAELLYAHNSSQSSVPIKNKDKRGHALEVKKNTCMFVSLYVWTYPVADLDFVVAGIFGFLDSE
jgi:hypothetical protein